MADTSFASADALTNKKWATDLFYQAHLDLFFAKYIGDGPDNIIQRKKDLEKDAGDRLTYGLLMNLSGAGTVGDLMLEGNEEALVFYDDTVTIDQIRHAVRVGGRMTSQRVPYNLRTEARDALKYWMSDMIDTKIMNHLDGVTTETFPNVALAPSANRLMYAGTATSTATIDATMKMDLTLLDEAKVKAKMATPKIRPVKIKGQEFYVVIMGTYQARDLRRNTNTGQWMDIQKMANVRGTDNPIFSGSLGVYNGMILFEYEKMPTYTTWGAGANVGGGEAMLLGAQAAVIAYGKGDGESATWFEKEFDYGNKQGVSGGLVWGVKKCRFNNEDFGVIVLRTAAAA